jgi:iron-sulfur cluster assembly accessory protein
VTVQSRVSVTLAAQKFMRRMVRFGGQGESAGFRLVVAAGGCSGYDASFNVLAEPRPGDEVLEFDDLRIYLPAASRLLLDGVTVDFADAPTSAGLTFVNPAAGACGCASGASSATTATGVTRVSIDAIRRR